MRFYPIPHFFRGHAQLKAASAIAALRFGILTNKR